MVTGTTPRSSSPPATLPCFPARADVTIWSAPMRRFERAKSRLLGRAESPARNHADCRWSLSSSTHTLGCHLAATLSPGHSSQRPRLPSASVRKPHQIQILSSCI
jgi:hypothetical protein